MLTGLLFTIALVFFLFTQSAIHYLSFSTLGLSHFAVPGQDFIAAISSFVNASRSYVDATASYVNAIESYVNATASYVDATASYVNATAGFVNAAPHEVNNEPAKEKNVVIGLPATKRFLFSFLASLKKSPCLS